MGRVMAERASGVQELMEMMGVTPLPLAMSHILNACFPTLITSIGITLLMKIGNNPLFARTSAFLIFMAFFLHSLSLIFFGLIFSYIGKKAPNIGIVVAAVYTFATLPAIIVFFVAPLKRFLIDGLGLLMSMPLCYILREAVFQEYLQKELSFSNMSKAHFVVDASALLSFIYLLLQMFISSILCWYLEHVVTGVYGSALPWNFPCQKSYLAKKASKDSNVATQETQVPDSRYFEPASPNLKAGIRAMNVTKDYKNNPGALNNFSLDVYVGEITVLLGHNGAGKSTLISVITGLTNPTKGKVLVNGYDIVRDKAKARADMGLCPQYNMFLEYISVLEHVMFFTLIKRGSFQEARRSAQELLAQLNIADKADNSTSQLSGGMKRRVQLACALAGNAKVLLLDEPTAGLDVETRRSLWDLLLSLRGSRTVLLSTHFMEEADALGDRVAAMNAGQLRSHATPMYLKRSLGTGYRLNLETVAAPNESAITNTVQSVLSNATVKEVTPHGISYSLPLENTKSYPELFSKLESKKAELEIQSISVGVSTLEEVFLKLCSGTDLKFLKEAKHHKAPVYHTLTGFQLFRRQFVELIKRYLRFLWTHKWTQIFFGIIFIMFMIFVAMVISNGTELETQERETMDLSRSTEGSRVLYKDKYSLRTLSDQLPNVRFSNVKKINKAAFERRSKMNSSRNVVGIEISDSDAKVIFNKSAPGGAGAALNLITNVIAARSLPQLQGRAITVHHHAFADVYPTQSNRTIQLPKSIEKTRLWAFYVTVFIFMGLTCMMSLPPAEYRSGARASHVMAGCSPELHWTTMLLMNTLQVTLTYVLALIISCATLDKDDTFTDGGFLSAMFVYVPLGSMAVLACMCYLTFSMTENFTLSTVVGMNVCGFVTIPIILKIKGFSQSTFLKIMSKLLVPQYAFYSLIDDCAGIARINALCNLNRKSCPDTDFLNPAFDGACCGFDSNPISYFSMDEVGEDYLILFFLLLYYMLGLFMKQRGLHSKIWAKCTQSFYQRPESKISDQIMKEEQALVEQTLKKPHTEIKEKMLASDLHKKYIGCCKTFNAVKGVSFFVKKGECFGLLGVNGAGKSTVFQMLTVTHSPTIGTIFANKHMLRVPCIMKYMRSLAYCPQFDGLDEFLTARQNLTMLLTFKGLSPRDADKEAMSWIKLVAMENYTDRRVWEYSGGCKRRMAAAAALCTSAPVTLLDEPTAGVDVAARRAVWAALKRALMEQRAIIITSHSLDEMEMLCHRIAIMAAGEICVLGSPAALKAAYALGHSITFNLQHFAEGDETREEKVKNLKRTIEGTFKCVLKDEHKAMLHYHISETMPYSKLFQDMEQLKDSSSGLIQDYSVSETTLEEVFLSFAKLQEPPPEKAKVKFKDAEEGKNKKQDKKSDGSTSMKDSKTDGKDSKTDGTDGKTDGRGSKHR